MPATRLPEETWISRVFREYVNPRTRTRGCGWVPGLKATIPTEEPIMPETTSNPSSGQQWTDEQVQELRALAKGNTPVGVMSIKLGRTEDAIRSKAKSEGVTLSPPNRSPYGDMS